MDGFHLPARLSDKSRTTEQLRFVAHLLFLGAYFVLNNPFAGMATATKFLVFAVMVSAAAAISLKIGQKHLGSKLIWCFAFCFFYCVAILRLNEIQSERYNESFILGYQQAALSLLAFVTSMAFAKCIDSRMTAIALFVASVPCGVWIVVNFPELTDFALRETFELGNLRYDSYQISSTILAVGALSALGLFDWRKVWSIRNWIYFSIFVAFGYCIFRGLARGEAIAFVLATALFVMPRVTLIAAPFSYAILNLLVISIDSPLIDRFRVVLEGDYGARDVLLQYVFDMLVDEPRLLLVGGGLNYYQKYWSLTSGTYPHNIVLEGLISGGLGLMLSLLACFIYPVAEAYRRALFGKLAKEDAFMFSLAVLLTIIALKSGSLLTFWGHAIFLCIFLDLLRRKTVPQHSRQPFPQSMARPPQPHPVRRQGYRN